MKLETDDTMKLKSFVIHGIEVTRALDVVPNDMVDVEERLYLVSADSGDKAWEKFEVWAEAKGMYEPEHLSVDGKPGVRRFEGIRIMMTCDSDLEHWEHARGQDCVQVGHLCYRMAYSDLGPLLKGRSVDLTLETPSHERPPQIVNSTLLPELLKRQGEEPSYIQPEQSTGSSSSSCRYIIHGIQVMHTLQLTMSEAVGVYENIYLTPRVESAEEACRTFLKYADDVCLLQHSDCTINEQPAVSTFAGIRAILPCSEDLADWKHGHDESCVELTYRPYWLVYKDLLTLLEGHSAVVSLSEEKPIAD